MILMSDDRVAEDEDLKTSERRWTFRSTVAVAAILALAICSAFAIAGTRMADAFDRVRETRAVIAAADGLLTALTDAETGQRGYLLTGDEAYLAPYYSARPLVGRHLDELDRLFRSINRQRALLDRLPALVFRKMTELEETIILRRVGGLAAAIDVVSDGRGAASMAEIRSLLTDLRTGEQQELDTHTADVLTSFRAGGLLAGISVLGLIILTFVYLRAQEQAQRRQLALTDGLKAAKADLERRVEERTAELARANTILSRFLANVSHELRTPLNAIIGYADAIATRMLGPVGHERYVDFARNITFSGRHLLDMINHILDFSKVEAGGLELEALDPVSVAEGCIDMIRPMADEARVELLLDAGDAPQRIIADPLRLRQILLNLLSNAVKFTPEGGQVRLELAAVPVDAGTPWLIRLRVRDDGIGMTPDQVQVALTPFGQVDNAMGRRHAGTGLGLPLTRHLVDLHGGRFDIQSAPGAGTTVEIAL
jgi:signal transduction histidine kinase